jgi:TonB family protein
MGSDNVNATASNRVGSPLHKTRLIRQGEQAGGWGIGVLIGIGANAILIWVLVGITHVRHESVAPQMVVRMNRVDPPPQDPLTQEPEETEMVTETPAELPVLALPPLALASVGDAAVILPMLPAADVVDFPIGIPAFTTALAVVSGDLSLPATALTFDEPAQLTTAFDLDRFYPRAAKIRGVEGESAIRLAIDVHGKVTACTLIRSSPPGVFDDAAVRLGRTLRFRPARRSDQDLPSILIQNIVWKLKQ